MNGIYLLPRGDDLGTWRSAAAAALDAWHNGILCNGGFIVPAPYFDEAAEMFSGEKGFCAGVHTAITCEWHNLRWGPVSSAAIVPFLLEKDATLRCSVTGIRQSASLFNQILAEIQTQLDIARSRNLTISYVDTHMSYGWLRESPRGEQFAERFSRWAESEGVIDATRFNPLTLATPPLTAGRKHRAPTSSTDRIAALVSELASLPPGLHQLVGHPAWDDSEMRTAVYGSHAAGIIARERDSERRFFSDPRILAVVAQRAIRPVTVVEAAALLSAPAPS